MKRALLLHSVAGGIFREALTGHIHVKPAGG